MPIAAYHIAADGTVSPTTPDAPATTDGYRWLHWEYDDPALEPWVRAHLPDPVRRAILAPNTRPRATAMEGGIVTTLRGVNLNPGADTDDMVSMRLWCEAGLIVTVRHIKIFALDAIRQRIEAGTPPPGIGHFLNQLTNGLTERIEAVSLALDAQTDDMEERVFDERVALEKSFSVGPLLRKTIKLRRFVRPQTEALRDLAAVDAAFIEDPARVPQRETLNRAERSVEELESVRDRLMALQDHLDMQHQTRMGNNGYMLTVVAAVFLPLGFLTGLFGVNVAGMPGVETPVAFWTLVLLCCAIGVAVWLFFRWKKWI